MKRLVVLASGAGSNFENIVSACQRHEIAAQVVGLICDSPKAAVLDRANRLQVPSAVIRRADFPDPAAFENEQLRQLRQWHPNFIVLAGYLKKIGPNIIQEYRGRMLNVHPSLLPKFGGHGMYGQHVFVAILAAKEAHSGVTVHWVSEEFDRGPVILQRAFPLDASETVETLRHKTQRLEHQLYVEVLKGLCHP